MNDIVEELRNRYMDTKRMIPCDLEHRAANQIESLRHKLEMAEACLAGDNALIVGLKNDISEKDAEIARRVTVDEMNAEIESATKAVALYYETQLAASQAREQQLRETLDNHSGNYKLSKDECKKINAILDDTQDTTALEAMITKAGEVMRNRMIASGFSQPHEEYFGCIIQLTIKSLPPITLKDLE